MSCHVCVSRHPRLSFLCPTCARNRLYPLRLETIHTLLDKETLGHHVEAIVASLQTQNEDPAGEERSSGTDQAESRRLALQTISSQLANTTIRKDALARDIEALKEDLKARETDITARKATLARRRSDAESALYNLEEREGSVLTSTLNTAKRTEHLWHSLHTRTAEARIFLCREAAHLHGLRQRTARKGDARSTFVLGGIQVVDLREMNGATPAQVSTSLSNIARLLVLISHYLSLRLPAEIILPHRNWPTPAINVPAASYLSSEAPREQDTPQSSASSPTTSKAADQRVQSRPRPLFIDKPLSRLAKEDPPAYAFFLEGATLLAWDVAWLCRTQGINLTSDSWEEVCDIGKSMWQLLIAPPAQASTLLRAFTGRDTQTKVKPAKDSPQTTIQRPKSFPVLGHYSHGTVHSFLGTSEGSEFVRTWKLPTPTKVADKLKTSLLGEMASAEWELLEEEEWDDGNEQNDRWKPANDRETLGSSKVPPNLGHEGADGQTSSQTPDEGRRPSSTNGWMKLNNR